MCQEDDKSFKAKFEVGSKLCFIFAVNAFYAWKSYYFFNSGIHDYINCRGDAMATVVVTKNSRAVVSLLTSQDMISTGTMFQRLDFSPVCWNPFVI